MNARMMAPGVWLYGLASIASGLLDFHWGNFDPATQPIHALSDNVPHERLLAYIAAAWLVIAGLSVLSRKAARLGAIALVVAYTAFAIFWFPRFWTAPRFLGHHASIYFGIFAGVAEELILVAAGLLIYALWATGDAGSRSVTISVARGIFGVCTMGFGFAHLTDLPANANMVPKWMPLGPSFWVVLTGIAFLLAGLAILFRVLDVLASRLLAAMLTIFSVFALIPIAIANPHEHGAWGTNVYNLTAIAAFWILASSLASLRAEPSAAAGTP